MSGRDPAALAVDVVIDNYNYAEFLPAAIESALAQTHERLRVIVVDDGSTDDSAEVLRRYEDRVTAVLKENGGHASAFNAGFDRCEGDVVIYLDADDLLNPEAAARAAAAFAADERVVKTQSRMEVVDAEGGPTGLVKPPSHIPMPNGDVQAEELSQPFDLPWVPTSANAFGREAMAKVMPIPPEEYRMCAERYLVHLLPLLGRVVSLDFVGAYYRVHGDNAYESLDPQLNMDRLRLTIRVERSTAKGLLELAEREGIPYPERILSIADLANRMISLRLEPDLHPIPEDTRMGLVRSALAASRRRSNAGPAMKAMFAGWFAAMAVAPRPLARRLATLFLFPEKRPGLNKLLGRFQRSPG
jgi:glycosyltransferase involved in cell wall biosynthesis